MLGLLTYLDIQFFSGIPRMRVLCLRGIFLSALLNDLGRIYPKGHLV